MRWNKKGDTVVIETTIFLLINVVFIVLMLWFVYSSGKGAFVYEEVYAKQIALLIDNAEPDMTIGMNIENLVKIAESNGKAIDKIVSVDEKENRVIVSLSNKGGHSFRYFSDYDIEFRQTEVYLSIIIKEKNENVE